MMFESSTVRGNPNGSPLMVVSGHVAGCCTHSIIKDQEFVEKKGNRGPVSSGPGDPSLLLG